MAKLKKELQAHLPVHKACQCSSQPQPQNKAHVHVALLKQSLQTAQQEHAEGIEVAKPAWGCLIFNEL